MRGTNRNPRTPQANNTNDTKKSPHQNEGRHNDNAPQHPVTPAKKKRGSISAPKPPTMIPAAPSLDYSKVQEDEIEALKSIFMDDYEAVEAVGAWNRRNPAFNIHLKAPSDSEVSCVLFVIFTATYPKTAPQLNLTGSPAIRPNDLETLRTIVSETPRNILGQEMIYEITSSIQEVLENIAQSKLADKDKPSLGEERTLNVMAAEQRAQKEREEARNLEERKALEAQRKLEQEIAEELRRQEEHTRESDERRKAPSIDYNDTATDDGVLFDRVITIKRGHSAGSLAFRKVSGMVRVATGPVMSVYTVRPVLSPDQRNDLPLVLKQVDLPDISDTSDMDRKQQIQKLEQQLDSLRILRHTNVAEVYESKVSRQDAISVGSDDSSTSPGGGWQISLLMEYSNRGSLHDLLETVGCLSAEMVRSWTISLLEALDYLHRKGIAHRGIHAGNILLFRQGFGNTVIPKLTDISFTEALWEIIDSENGPPENSTVASARSVFWIPPESSKQIKAPKSGRKTDIWNLGVVLLQMLFGLKVMEKYNSLSALVESMNISHSLRELLERIFRVDTRKRPTSFDLLPSEFLRNNDPVLAPTPPSPTPSRASSFVQEGRNTLRARLDSIGGSNSRYATDFTELGSLGKGAFGEVVKARNKLDGNSYAIKKISKINGSKMNHILHEVMLLSRLHHKYVIRYFTAWLEEEDPTRQAVSGESSDEGDGEDDEDEDDEDDEDDEEDENDSYDPFEDGESSGAVVFSDGSITAKTVESTSDSGAVEFAHSASGLDFISGNAYSKTNFADNLNLMRRASSSGRNSKSTLYIQMSLADQQANKINNEMEVDEAWKLLRQVLEGLAHIHGLGIIHRDLKPENIFIDLNGDPLIGDFGLATSGQVSSKIEPVLGSDDEYLSTDVGTALYVAPEVKAAQGHGKYDGRADMYSLGIIFFEMCYPPLVTGMERGKVIGKLREEGLTFPADFQIEKYTAQESIIRSLLCHDPSARPSSMDLLNSGKLPFKVEDETIRRALQSISDPGTPYHQQVMSALFSQSTKEYKDHTYDLWKSNLSPNGLILHAMVKERLSSIFRHHGAVETTRPLLLPRSKLYKCDVVQLLDRSGALVQLPYDLTLPHARSLARQESPGPKTFTFGTVYRENPAGGQPRSHAEVDFDIISYDSLDLALKEAEVLKVIDEIVDAFPSLRKDQMCYHVNHSDLLDLIMEFCRVDAAHRPAVAEILSKLNTGHWFWPRIRNDIIASGLGILPTSVDDLAKFDWRDENEKAFRRLRALFNGSGVADRANIVFAHIEAVIGYLERFGVTGKIYVNPLGTWNDKFYRGGIVFQCLVESNKKGVLAAGGRYDSLIQRHRPAVRGTTEEPHAVGFNMALETLFAGMSRHQKNSKLQQEKGEDDNLGIWAARRCDVLVASFSKSALRTHGLTVLQDLWANGISAELAGDASTLEQLISSHKRDGITWVVIIKQVGPASAGENIYKVKNLFKKEDTELRMGDLVSFLKSEMAEREKRERAIGNPGAGSGGGAGVGIRTAPRHPSSGELPGRHGGGDELEMDVRILPRERKGKKMSKNVIVDGAQRTASELLSGFLHDAPIAAIDVRDDILDEIKHSSLQEPESWRKIIQSAPAMDRKYISQVQELLQELAASPTAKSNGCFIYNYRSGGIIFYYLV